MTWQRVPAGRVLSGDDKALPAWATGMSAEAFLAAGARLSDLWTPALVLDESALLSNAAFVAGWTAAHGLELMPHGKTTMAPQLWRLQRDAGATGLTVATGWQLRVARAAGPGDVMLAGQIADARTAGWLAGELAADAGRVWSWVDSADGIRLLAAHAGARPFEVLVELGRPGGRTGARGRDAARRLAAEVRATAGLRLAGVAGYEGAIAHGRGAGALDDVAAFTADLVGLHEELLADADDPGDLIVTAGGSAYPDVVAEVLAAAAARLPGRFVLRSGASLVHDEGYYASVSPFEGAGLRAAARAVARVVSAPEPGLALLDAGRRDVPYDIDLPVPLGIGAAEVTALNDQHAFVRTDHPLALGDRVMLGLSHPCTMFDKWRLIPVVSSFAHDDPPLVGLVETRF
ncbi:amino acid aldolase [Microbacterium sp. W1N]|uniref:amino acid aldolase n=1 Tax=Microbacterium festucae TaxID=2977531 RepID=UPI0021C03153|nr:amino acid aldolase [Microbacterium festucae]MCT9820366.1 amino acid aldolase [Microbacterium festucae]